jgi:hypothetical protein
MLFFTSVGEALKLPHSLMNAPGMVVMVVELVVVVGGGGVVVVTLTKGHVCLADPCAFHPCGI